MVLALPYLSELIPVDPVGIEPLELIASELCTHYISRPKVYEEEFMATFITHKMDNSLSAILIERLVKSHIDIMIYPTILTTVRTIEFF